MLTSRRSVLSGRARPEPGAFLGICEATGGCYGATVVQQVLGRGCPMWLIENALARHMREKVVEVDTETGQVEIVRLAAAYDVGKAINPDQPFQFDEWTKSSKMEPNSKLCRRWQTDVDYG